MNWAEWGPTVVSIITAVFISGMIYGKVKDHEKKICNLDMEVEAIKVRIGLGEVELAKLQSWRDGYNAATNRRDGYDAASKQHKDRP